jgi:hypothetical protein
MYPSVGNKQKNLGEKTFVGILKFNEEKNRIRITLRSNPETDPYKYVTDPEH